MSAALLAFLRARLDEDEQAASAASDGPWTPWRGKALLHGLGQLEHGVMLPGQGVGYRASIATASWMDAEHVARHDPARVLAEVGMKRRIVALHSDPTGHSCSIADHTGYELNYADVAAGEACTTLRLLALPYADHSDFEREWAP